uniref:Uncharacterized protein n=1 Tax=Romanomermis culicivorax TaxID=13658 RepID=A0A915JIH1_ROMCU
MKGPVSIKSFKVEIISTTKKEKIAFSCFTNVAIISSSGSSPTTFAFYYFVLCVPITFPFILKFKDSLITSSIARLNSLNWEFAQLLITDMEIAQSQFRSIENSLIWKFAQLGIAHMGIPPLKIRSFGNSLNWESLSWESLT